MATVIDKLLVEIGVDNQDLKKGVKESTKILHDADVEINKLNKIEDEKNRKSKLAAEKAAAAAYKKREDEKTKGLKKGEKERQKSLKSSDTFGSSVNSALGSIGKGIAAYATISKGISLAKSLGSDAASMQRLSTSMNLAPDKLKKYSNMLEAIGGNGDDALSSLKGLQDAVNDLQVNGVFGEKLLALSRLGVPLTDENGRRKDEAQLFEESRIKLNAIPDKNMRASLASQLGYSSNTQFMMEKTDEAWRKLSEDADVSIALYKENAKAMQEVNQQLHTFGVKLETVGTQILGKIIDSPAFKAVIGWLDSAPKNADEIGNKPTGNVTGTIGLISAVGSGIAKGVGEGVENSKLYNDVKTKLSSNYDKITGKTANENRDKSMKFLIDKGWTREQAAGLVANFSEESGMNPNAIGDNGNAIGIAQWQPKRQRDFKELYGKKLAGATLEEQLTFADWELNNTESAAGNKLRATKNAGVAGATTSLFYERPSAKNKEANERAQLAGGIYANSISQSLPRDKASDKASGTQINVDNVTINTQSSDVKGIKREFSGKMTALAEGGMR